METEEQRKEVQNQLVDRECKLSSKWLCLRHYLFSAYFVLEDHQSMFYLLFTSLVSFKNIVLLFLTLCIWLMEYIAWVQVAVEDVWVKLIFSKSSTYSKLLGPNSIIFQITS